MDGASAFGDQTGHDGRFSLVFASRMQHQWPGSVATPGQFPFKPKLIHIFALPPAFIQRPRAGSRGLFQLPTSFLHLLVSAFPLVPNLAL